MNLSKKRVAIFVGVVIILAAIIAPVAYFVTKPDKLPRASPAKATVPAPRRLPQKINCIPESGGNVVKVTKHLCDIRNCEFIPTTTAWEAACVFPPRTKYGFSVVGVRSMETSTGYRIYLKQKGPSAFNSTPFKTPYFEVQTTEENLIRFKVNTYILLTLFKHRNDTIIEP